MLCSEAGRRAHTNVDACRGQLSQAGTLHSRCSTLPVGRRCTGDTRRLFSRLGALLSRVKLPIRACEQHPQLSKLTEGCGPIAEIVVFSNTCGSDHSPCLPQGNTADGFQAVALLAASDTWIRPEPGSSSIDCLESPIGSRGRGGSSSGRHRASERPHLRAVHQWAAPVRRISYTSRPESGAGAASARPSQMVCLSLVRPV